jgi:hypothetical protein
MKIIVKRPFELVMGSHTRNVHGTHRMPLITGDILTFDYESDNGNVWFYTLNKQCGKIECGSLDNMVKSGMISIDRM